MCHSKMRGYQISGTGMWLVSEKENRKVQEYNGMCLMVKKRKKQLIFAGNLGPKV